MNNKTGKLTIIGCGGAGINLGITTHNTLKELGEGYSEVDIELLDTTHKTIHNYTDFIPKFTKITTDRIATSQIDGAGGEKKDMDLATDIFTFLKGYLDKKKFENNKNNYYVIMCSASGGSGGNIASLLTGFMLSKGYNVIVATIGDSSNYLNLKNTIHTIRTLQKAALSNKKALCVIYYNNTVKNNTTVTSEENVNKKIITLLSTISVFTSGTLTGVDDQDMINFFNATNYTTFTVPPGIYSIGINVGTLGDVDTLMSRTIISDKEAVDIQVPLFHNKTSVIPAKLASTYKQYPLYLLFRKNILQKETKILNAELIKMDELLQVEYDPFDDIDLNDDITGLGILQ